MGSEIISVRLPSATFVALSKFSRENGVYLSTVVKQALVTYVEKGYTKDFPEWLKNALRIVEADTELKLRMSRSLFLHNVRGKIRKLVIVERCDKSRIKSIVGELLDHYIKNAVVKGWEFEADYLAEMKKKATSKDVEEASDFARWSGIAKRLANGY